MRFTIQHLVLFLLGAACLHAAVAPITVEDLSRPFPFSYFACPEKAHNSNGVAVLRGFINNQGGAGLNGEWNLADQAALIPALKLKVGPSNQAAAWVLLLKDAGEGEGRWEFPLPAAGGESGYPAWPDTSSS